MRGREASHPAVVIIVAATATATAAASAPPRRCTSIPQDVIEGDTAVVACAGAMGRGGHAGGGGRGAPIRGGGGGGGGVAILHDGKGRRDGRRDGGYGMPTTSTACSFVCGGGVSD